MYRRLTHCLFVDSLFPFLAPTSLSQVLNLVDQMALRPGLSNTRRGWDAKETDDALHLRVDMPGLGKEDVKVSVEQNTLIIKGEGAKEMNEEEDEELKRYSSRIELPDKVFKTDEIKAEMKNGVLKVVVPKMKEEERKDVFHIKVE